MEGHAREGSYAYYPGQYSAPPGERANSSGDKNCFPPPLPPGVAQEYIRYSGQQGYYLPGPEQAPPVQGGYPPYGGQYPSVPMGQFPYTVPQMGGFIPQQRQAIPWMAPPPSCRNCPPGLEYLTQLDQILVKQQKEFIEVITNIETPNRYICLNTMGQQVYMCKEESDYCIRQFCKSRRPFTMHIEDNTGMEVIRIDRPYKYTCCSQCCSCSDCCLDEVTVEAPVGQVVGYVKQVWECCHPVYNVMDRRKDVVLRIRGPHICKCHCTESGITFKVLSKDGDQQVGTIVKQWTNIIQEYLTDADNFGVTFPGDLDVRVKATLIAAVFLIDFMHFEDDNPQSNQRNHR